MPLVLPPLWPSATKPNIVGNRGPCRPLVGKFLFIEITTEILHDILHDTFCGQFYGSDDPTNSVIALKDDG